MESRQQNDKVMDQVAGIYLREYFEGGMNDLNARPAARAGHSAQRVDLEGRNAPRGTNSKRFPGKVS